jgi:hypothetical protein
MANCFEISSQISSNNYSLQIQIVAVYLDKKLR